MKTWLVENGVSEERVIEETQAESTRQNIDFSAAIIRTRTPDYSGKVCIITEGYHVLRARMFAKGAGLDAVAVYGNTHLPVLTVNYYFREAFAVWYYLIKR